MHILIGPSFFFTNIVDTPNGKWLGLIKPLSNNSYNCFFSSYSSTEAILYGAFEIYVVPKVSLTLNPISVLGANPGKL